MQQRLQAIALNNYVMLKKQLDVDMDQEINKLVQKYNKLQLPLMEKVKLILFELR